MTRTLILSERATDCLAGFLRDDPAGVEKVFHEVDQLLVDPYPDNSFSLGMPDRRRLRVGQYRVWYGVRPTAIDVDRVGRVL